VRENEELRADLRAEVERDVDRWWDCEPIRPLFEAWALRVQRAEAERDAARLAQCECAEMVAELQDKARLTVERLAQALRQLAESKDGKRNDDCIPSYRKDAAALIAALDKEDGNG
jgi:hypothetical protein